MAKTRVIFTRNVDNQEKIICNYLITNEDIVYLRDENDYEDWHLGEIYRDRLDSRKIMNFKSDYGIIKNIYYNNTIYDNNFITYIFKDIKNRYRDERAKYTKGEVKNKLFKTLIHVEDIYKYVNLFINNMLRLGDRKYLKVSYCGQDYQYANPIYRNLILYKVKTILSVMNMIGIVNIYLGNHDENNDENSYYTRIAITKIFYNLYHNKSLIMHNKYENACADSYIRLKSINGNVINREFTRNINSVARGMMFINNELKKHRISYSLDSCIQNKAYIKKKDYLEYKINTYDSYYIRSFLYGAYCFGGEFCNNSLIDLRKNYIQYLRINNNSVITANLQCLCLYILASLSDFKLPSEDLYSLGKFPQEIREYIKKVIIYGLNSESRDKCLNYMKKTYNQYAKRYENVPNIGDIYDYYEKELPFIKEYLFQSCYGILARKSSRLAYNVMRYMAGQHICCLTNNRYFIVEDKFKDILINTIRNKYSVFLLGKPDIIIN